MSPASWKGVSTGSKYGSIVGYVLGQLYLSSNSPLGFYGGNVLLVFLVTIGPCALLGAGLGLLIANDDNPSL